jgi:diguanylate cyclase (GGDEF)-like protein
LRRIKGDLPLLALVVFGVLSSLFFLLDLGDDAFKVRVTWLLQVPMDAAFTYFAWHAARMPGAEPSVRRYLRVLTFTAGMFTIADSIQLASIIPHASPTDINGGLAQTVFFLIGCTAIVITMLRYPTPHNSPGDRLRFWLDATTVLVGGAVLAWCITVDPSDHADIDWFNTVAVASVVLVAAFASVKMLLSGTAPLTRGAAVPMTAAALLQGASIFITPSTTGAALRPELLALRMLPSLLIAVGPRIHELQTRDNPRYFQQRRSRPYSVLPYFAVAVTFLVLLLVLPHETGARVWGVVAGVVLITGVVVGRQLLTFHDNAELITRLDATLLDLRGHQTLLHEQATHDGLTRLANRTAFGDEVTATLAGLDRPDAAPVAVLLIDLDDFKTVNDTLGHGVGDALLVEAAGRLSAAVRPGDLVARLGGDEFAVLLRGVSPEDAGHFADRILTAVGRPVQLDGHTLVVRASVGVAPAVPGDDLEGLLRNADIAMYAAKDAGKGGFQRYAADMGARIKETAELGQRLHEAIGTDQFRLEFQPVVDLDTGAMVGAETLVRWHPPDRGVVPPTEFIPAAERTGLIVPLGRWILREACRQLAEWRRAYPAAHDVTVGVNVAGRQLLEPGFVDEVAAALTTNGLPADRLVIEVTETAVLDGGGATATLHALRRLGVGLALDDFGTAASSLGLLLTCPVSALKLDRSFVERLGADSRQTAVATAVIQIARALHLNAIAEGVETAEQADLLRRLGYRRAQGYLFSRPLPGSELAIRWHRPLAQVSPSAADPAGRR